MTPVTEEQAPGYHDAIKRPVDLKTIKRHVEDGTIKTTMEFYRDLLLMFQNAIMYNDEDTLVWEAAEEMRDTVVKQMTEFMANESSASYVGDLPRTPRVAGGGGGGADATGASTGGAAHGDGAGGSGTADEGSSAPVRRTRSLSGAEQQPPATADAADSGAEPTAKRRKLRN